MKKVFMVSLLIIRDLWALAAANACNNTGKIVK